MKSRYEVAIDLGFQESESSPGLLWWFIPDHEDNLKIFMDFRTQNENGEYDDFEPDMPPRVYGAIEDDEGDTVWINKNGETRERWKNEVKDHWTVGQVEEKAGLDTDDRGQTGLDWFAEDGLNEYECEVCGETYPMSDLEDGLCIGDETNGCFYDEHPEELFRKAARRKKQIRNE